MNIRPQNVDVSLYHCALCFLLYDLDLYIFYLACAAFARCSFMLGLAFVVCLDLEKQRMIEKKNFSDVYCGFTIADEFLDSI